MPAFYDGEPNSCYAEVYGMRLVEVEPFGDFILVNPQTTNDGGRKEIKTCKAYSLEFGFNYKRRKFLRGHITFTIRWIMRIL